MGIYKFVEVFFLLVVLATSAHSQKDNDLEDNDKYTEDYKKCAQKCKTEEKSIANRDGEVEVFCRSSNMFGLSRANIHGPCMLDCMVAANMWKRDEDQKACLCKLCQEGLEGFCLEKGSPVLEETQCDDTICAGKGGYFGTKCTYQ